VKITRSVATLIFIAGFCCHGADEAEDTLNQARQLASEGKFEEALQKHIWFHDHALEIRPSYYGVRLSYALSDWIELGKRYPKALDALKAIRDQKTRRLLGGELERTLFHDVVAINDSLGESKATVELFKRIELAQPEFASSISNFADEAFFAAKEYALARKYLGDPCSRFDLIRSHFDWGLEYARTSSYPRSRQCFENIFSRHITRLIVVLDKTGDGGLARQIQSDALAVCNSRAIQEALTK
jgi:tetratricopeptide (TPR) repeat protein